MEMCGVSIWHIVLCRSLCEFLEITISVRELKVRYTSTLVVQWGMRIEEALIVSGCGAGEYTNYKWDFHYMGRLIGIDRQIYSCMYSFLVHLIHSFLP